MNTYRKQDTQLFVTDAYSSEAPDITVSSDVDDTEQYSVSIVLTKDTGMNIDVKHIEIGGTTQTDSLVTNIYRSRNGIWTYKETVSKPVDCGNVGVANGFRIESIMILGWVHGLGHYLLGFLSDGGTNTFDLVALGRLF